MPEQSQHPEGGKPAPTSLHKVLADATALIAPSLLQDLKSAGPRTAQFAEQGEYALWMDLLFKVGAIAEARGRDAELPPGFWSNLEGAARGMRFPEFIPLAVGKAEGRPKRTMGDFFAGVAVIHRQIGNRWAGCFPDQPTQLNEYVNMLGAIDPEYPALLQTEGRESLARRFEADGCMEEPSPDDWFPVREQLRTVFYPLFDFIHTEDFPESLDEERWSIVNFNAFELKPIGGMFPVNEARPWWA